MYIDPEKEFFRHFTSSNSVPKTYFFDGELKQIGSKSGAGIVLKDAPEDQSKMMEQLYGDGVDFADFSFKTDDFYKILKSLTLDND